jgi:hypothetical protein
LKALKDINPPIKVTVRPDYVNNWFTGFTPINWGRKKQTGAESGYGKGVLGYAFNHTKNYEGDDYVRLHIGVEKPFKEEFKDKFKKDVSVAVATKYIILPPGCRIWPNSKFSDFKFHGTSLIECQPILLSDNTWEFVSNNYMVLNKEYNALITQLLRSYYNKRAFNIEIDFNN